MKKAIFTASILAVLAISSPASAKWKDSVGKEWDTIDQCFKTRALPCTWGGKMVVKDLTVAAASDAAVVAKGGPVNDPLTFTLIKEGDIKLPDAKIYCKAADGAISNMPLHSSKCGGGRVAVMF